MKTIETRLTIEIDEKLKNDFKAETSRRGSTLRETLETLIENYLETKTV